ncbi:MAG TPA: prolipoprotein diacylglyceryl transferase [candidate division Zixibacteria bacterium]|nr:prolipoprotein diacylglyceryl transferase [candidate division Zixibacteria bacterium]MDD4916987.1 prolipoprotein diacylglyceryl transferase [candidate division Zixibacteria bacterium]MDM7972622.1 prolipoprotein diacylglyceryl transferase [candidate division Zixibacteria bacterium]HOD67007.1 prolipoprotein diacylglyceryl transferase [candidate division Zixibacteria bacterium]HPI32003.1 prolipoprotein diacylglyceryl transferase [candidate division Zixibacteria bacterium]
MHPELFHVGPVHIRSYGLMLAISFLLGVLYIWRVARRDGKPFEPLLTVAYLMTIGGIIGARLFYVLVHLDEFSGNWTRTFNPFSSSEFGIAGLNLYGGVLAAIVASFVYLRAKKLSVLDTFDYFAPTLGLGLLFTRVGCFLNGCCFGTPTELPWGISFPEGSLPYYIFSDAHLHPAQLYSSLYGGLLLIALHYVLRHRRFVGQAVALLFMIEAGFRYAIEYVRYYEDEMHLTVGSMHPTYNQLVSLGLFVLGLGLYLYQRRRAPLSRAAAPPAGKLRPAK